MRLFIILATLPLFGAYIGNPADPAIMNTGVFSSSYPFFKFTTGYIYDYTSNKRFESEQKNVPIDPDSAIKKFGLHSQMASFSFIFIERLQISGAAGGSKEVIKEQEQPLSEFIYDLHTSYHFSWSTGAKVILLQWWQTYLSADFTYFAIPESQQSFFKFLNRLNLPMDTEKQKLSLDEWQISLGLSSRIFWFTPYGGFTYLNSKLHVEEGLDIPALNYENAARWGYFYGVTLSLTGRLHLNFERRMRDEFSYTFSSIMVF